MSVSLAAVAKLATWQRTAGQHVEVVEVEEVEEVVVAGIEETAGGERVHSYCHQKLVDYLN